MQGHDDGQREIYDVEVLAGHLLPVGSVFAFLAEHRHDLFPDDAFEDLFPSKLGRPSTPADVIASVMVLQTLNNLSDREAAEAVTFDLRWKAACGFALTETSFHPTVLVVLAQTPRREQEAAPYLRSRDRGHREVGGAVGAEASGVGLDDPRGRPSPVRTPSRSSSRRSAAWGGRSPAPT